MAVQQPRRTLGAVLLATAALALLRGSCFVAAPAVAEQTALLRGGTVAQQAASAASLAALTLMADPAFASDYDDRQGTAAIALVGVCLLGVVVSGISFLIGKKVVEMDD
mmetsp:Transcript_58652/g.168437  ORF Transcript_58652/g.168437 Transcript_58652/m.168437 type:complete len:109 (-) Transcript_58652:170-496(-)|eukprot:CAMPEP_0177200080 /NCGR_PEP_ID=MMETSP0367-20130122/26027_1 /TAXON_ID=447022 ORGANISM="Scrippsiella hangoei-like, Strain SHHI-4" /NCGR_SAMPLE_ID=MMETSP0367 /ASSEMBLY_ACC=CAM_ASM_000362 /LENGTH=108 /DNA_ID=CAMNT_0018648493 /DNA_START=75 /DNA_END=401 /DNA_ORIENTATION=-